RVEGLPLPLPQEGEGGVAHELFYLGRGGLLGGGLEERRELGEARLVAALDRRWGAGPPVAGERHVALIAVALHLTALRPVARELPGAHHDAKPGPRRRYLRVRVQRGDERGGPRLGLQRLRVEAVVEVPGDEVVGAVQREADAPIFPATRPFCA